MIGVDALANKLRDANDDLYRLEAQIVNAQRSLNTIERAVDHQIKVLAELVEQSEDEIRMVTEKRKSTAEELLELQESTARAIAELNAAEEHAAKLPKDKATALGKPWVNVSKTHLDPGNIRNGFLELDWNSEFISELKKAGYGFDGDPDEEIVDRWFKELTYNMLMADGQNTDRHAGLINIQSILSANGVM